MTITVTRDDIRSGRRGAAMSCAVALAAQRAWDADFVFVAPRHISVDGGAPRPLPRRARWFVRAFDWVPRLLRPLLLRPFAFEV